MIGPHSNVKRFLGGFAKEIDPREPLFKKTGRRGINNLWSGYEFGGRAKFLASAGLLGSGGYYIETQPRKSMVQAQQQYQDIQSLPGTQGDMQGYEAYPAISVPGLEATGDLVFALHKTRHGV